MIYAQIKTILLQAASNTKNLWNEISVLFGLLGGFFVWLFGGWDSLIIALLTLMVADFVTGLIKGIYQKQLSSTVSFKGIMKKTMILVVVGASVVVQSILPDNLPLREITIMFFVCNEGISILENAAVLIPIPQRLKDVLLQLRDSENSEKKSK